MAVCNTDCNAMQHPRPRGDAPLTAPRPRAQRPASCRAAAAPQTDPSGEPLSARIAALEQELRALYQQRDAQFVRLVAAIVGARVAFSSCELWQHRVVNADLRDALDAADVRSVKQLGKRLQRLGDMHISYGVALERLGVDRGRAL